MKKKIIVLLTVLCIGLTTLIAAACGPGPEPESQYAFTFTGEIEMTDVHYNVTLNGKADGTFELKPNNLAPITGTYLFTAGKGYTFMFNDAAGMDYRTTYDAPAKEFWFIYRLDLGKARGMGGVKLTLKNETFVPDGEPFPGFPLFSGSTFNGILDLALIVKADATYRLYSPNMSAYVPEQQGTWTYSSNAYAFTNEYGTYTTAYSESKGYSLTIKLMAYNAVRDGVLTQVFITVG